MTQVGHSSHRLGGASQSAHAPPSAVSQSRPQPHPGGENAESGGLASKPAAMRAAAVCAGLAHMASLTPFFPGPLSSMTSKDAQAAAALFSLPLPSAAACASFATAAAAAVAASSSSSSSSSSSMLAPEAAAAAERGTKRVRRLSSCGSDLSSCTSVGTTGSSAGDEYEYEERGSSNGSESNYEEDDEGGVVFKRRRLTLEERQQRSRERNRMHAKKTRQRKKLQMDAMAQRIEELKGEFKQLRQVVEERYTAYILLNISAPPPLPVDMQAGQGAAAGGSSSSSGAAEDNVEGGGVSFGDILGRGGDVPGMSSGRGEEEDGACSEANCGGGGTLRTCSATSEELLLLGGGGGDDAADDLCGDEGGKAKRTRRRGKYTPAERETIRRERNRMHAKKTRDRKKLFLDEAELTIARMEGENATLRAFMRANGMAPQSDAVPAPRPQLPPLLAAATAPTVTAPAAAAPTTAAPTAAGGPVGGGLSGGGPPASSLHEVEEGVDLGSEAVAPAAKEEEKVAEENGSV